MKYIPVNLISYKLKPEAEDKATRFYNRQEQLLEQYEKQVELTGRTDIEKPIVEEYKYDNEQDYDEKIESGYISTDIDIFHSNEDGNTSVYMKSKNTTVVKETPEEIRKLLGG